MREKVARLEVRAPAMHLFEEGEEVAAVGRAVHVHLPPSLKAFMKWATPPRGTSNQRRSAVVPLRGMMPNIGGREASKA